MLAPLSRTAAQLLRNAADDLITTFAPSDCRICQRSLLRANLVPICQDCRAQVTPQTTTLCHRCGEALGMESARFAGQFAEEMLCSPCRLAPPAFERAVAHAVYENELREMIHLLKYERMQVMAEALGPMLAEAIATLEPRAAAELTVVPVPLFPAKQRQRGYNQSTLLARAALDRLRRSHPRWKLRLAPDALKRLRDTESQFTLDPRQRRRNLQGAFAATASRIVPGCEVLLVDDIYTTGATARECARVLRRAGAAKVWVATLARAQNVQIAPWDAEPQRAPQGFG